MTESYSSSAEAERKADRARDDLAGTLDRLIDNLSPGHLAEEAMAATRARTPDWLARAVDTLASPSGLALLAAAAASVGVTMARNRERRNRRGVVDEGSATLGLRRGRF